VGGDPHNSGRISLLVYRGRASMMCWMVGTGTSPPRSSGKRNFSHSSVVRLSVPMPSKSGGVYRRSAVWVVS
jgi:hypothetical protein